MKSVSVLVPAYNEQKLLKKSIMYYFNYLKQLGVDFEIIICANGCTDSTVEISKELSRKYSGIKYVDIPEKGLGAALNSGIPLAKKEFMTFMPADAEIKAGFIGEALKNTEKYDYISGSRKLSKHYLGKKASRKLANFVFSLIVRFCFKFKVTEIGTVRLWPTKWSQNRVRKFKSNGFEWQIEQLYWALKDKLKTKEIPVYAIGVRSAAESNVSLVKDSIPMLFSCIKHGIKLF
jgi:glycosyltransferase involved in cell wall biosynthesis